MIVPVTFTEGFNTAFRPRVASNQDPSQPGTVYNAESGFVKPCWVRKPDSPITERGSG